MDALMHAAYLMQASEGSPERRIGREFVYMWHADRSQYLADLLTVFNTGDREYHIAQELRALMEYGDNDGIGRAEQ